MFAIYKKELKSYFHSFIGFLFIGVSLFFIGLYYFVYCLLYGYPYFSYVVNSVTILFMLTVPILTMRIIAAETAALYGLQSVHIANDIAHAHAEK